MHLPVLTEFVMWYSCTCGVRASSILHIRRTSRPAILSSKNQSGFQGVNKSSRSGHWEAAIQEGGKRRFLGCFLSAEEAAHAYAREFARSGQVLPTLSAARPHYLLSPLVAAQGNGAAEPLARTREPVQGEPARSVWIQCDTCSKWRRIVASQAREWPL